MNPPGLLLRARPMALGLAILIAGLPLGAAPRKPLTPAAKPARCESTPPLPEEPGRVRLIAWRYGFPAVDRGGLSVVPAPGSGGPRPVEVRLQPGFRF